MQVELVHPMIAGGEGFVVHVLDDCGEMWEDIEDTSDAAVLVDAAGSVATSTRLCPALRPNAVERMWTYSLTGKHKRIKVVEVCS
jgi:DNA-binding response OmpR family regulator